MRNLLARLDETLTQWLLGNPSTVPPRWSKFLAYYYPDARVRKLYLRALKVEMGEGSFANPGLVVVTDPSSSGMQVQIGERVSVGPHVTIVCDSRPNNSPMLCSLPAVKERLIRNAAVIIEDDVWIGAGVVVLPGVRVGRGSIIGAGAVVTADVPAYNVVAGVPARTLRVLDVPDVLS